MNSLEIEGYSISMTTLEEVFLKANGISYEEKQDMQRRTSSINDDSNSALKDSMGEFDPDYDQSKVPGLRKSNPIQDHNLVGSGSSICSSIGALVAKRFFLYKRDKCGLVCEILVPVLLAILGLSLLKVGWLEDSPAFTLGTDAFPGPQRAVFNQDLVDVTTQTYTPLQIAQNLPDYETYWDLQPQDQTDITYREYYDYVCNQ